MNLEPTEEQVIVEQSVAAWLLEKYAFEQWRALAQDERGYSSKNWSEFADMGWLGLTLGEEYGGVGGSTADLMVLGEKFGSAMVLEPFFSTVVMGARLIELAGNEQQKSDWLPQIVAGRLKVAFAFAELESRFSLAHTALRAIWTGREYKLDGRKIAVLDAPHADLIIVLARVSGQPGERSGLGLFVVEPKASGLEFLPYTTLDSRRGADLVFAEVPVAHVLGEPERALEVVDKMVDRAIAYLTSEAVGTMQAALNATIDYVKVRKQFGKALAEFQVLQHRIVDMRIEIENTKSLSLLAALSIDGAYPNISEIAAAAKVQVGKSGQFVGRQSVQIHGGMGMTDAMQPGHFMKRLMAIEILFGDVDHHAQRFVELTDFNQDVRPG